MNSGLPTEQMGGADSQGFEQHITSYAQQLGILLRENPWTFWQGGFKAYGYWARRDPELQKTLARIYGLLHDIIRRHGRAEESVDQAPAVSRAQKILARAPGVLDSLHRHSPSDTTGERPDVNAATGPITDADQKGILQLLYPGPDTLTLDAALELNDALDRIMIEIGDAQYVCSEIAGELQWAKGSTTWLTWGAMYGTSIPDALEAHNSGKTVSEVQLKAARNQLLNFRKARSDDYQVHRARQKMRAKNLRILAVLLLPIVVAFASLLASKNVGGGSAWGVWLVAIAGSLGSVMSGTIKARDKLVRGSDLRAFRAGLMAQILLGAASALVLLLLLASAILEIAGTGSPEGKAALGFLAGFSEPFFLKTVERVAKMGEESGRKDEKSKTPGESS